MKNTPFIILLLIIAVTTFTGCQETLKLTMTAPEVCQYVNQALPNQHLYTLPTARYELHYTASSATPKLEALVEDDRGQNLLPDSELQHSLEEIERTQWLVYVNVIVEPQRLLDGQWVFDTRIKSIEPYVEQYLFNEATGALIKR